MKKFFIHSLVILAMIYPMPAMSGVLSATEKPLPLPSPEQRIKNIQKLYKELPDINDADAIREYVKKRFPIVQNANISPDEVSVPSATSIVDTEEMKNKADASLTAYEKIYNESMKRANNNETINENIALDGTFYRLKEDTPQKVEPFVPDFPYVMVKLSDNKEIMAPAEEHIPYLLSTIKIEPTGLLIVNEEFTFISNNEGFPAGFFRILPKYSYSNTGKRRRIDLSLLSVTINGEEVPYKITEIGKYLYIEPKKPLNLPTGIHVYKFNYMIDRAVWFYNNFDQLYWDITGKSIKKVIGSANAVVVLPTSKTFIAQNAIASTKSGLDANRVTITTIEPNILGFADTNALDVGEDIHLTLTLEKGTLLAPDFSHRFFWFIQDYGSIFFAILSLLAILLSYKISFAQIRRNKDKTNSRLKKTPAIYRLLNVNIYDYRSLGAELLNLCAKNILEIKQNAEKITLIKKTDNLKKLSKTENKLMTMLFPGQDTTLSSGSEAQLKIERAYKFLHQTSYKQFLLYKLKLNAAYLLFSISMLIIGQICAALLAINPTHTFFVIFCCTIIFTPCVLVLTTKIQKRVIDISLKILTALIAIYAMGILSIYTSVYYAVAIIASIFIIISYYKLFSKRNGLLRNKIKETEEYKSYLQKNPELTHEAKDYNTKIPYIFAFELEKKYPNTPTLNYMAEFLKQTIRKTAKD